MQIIIALAILIVAATVILYLVNKRFEKKEFIILLLIISIAIIGYGLYENKQKNFFPNMFKEKYEKEKKVVVEGLKAELINNKVVSSRDKFIYKFTYIIKKDDKEFLCVASNVEINRIENNFIFKEFGNLKEECVEK
jgi:hypothetical protein